jgi:dTDP-3-amino-3,4,6-trideoxy-alpha-D-glucose transaminase
MSAPTAPAAVPLCELDNAEPELFEELLATVRDLATTGAFIGGEAVEAFERDYAAWCETPHAIGVSSGTEALALALRALDIGEGDEVVVPANSFIATAEAVSLVGARPRFADVDPHTQLMTARSLECALTPAVRAVIPVHLFGRTVELSPILELARERGLMLVEDAAQAHGARYRGQRVGTFGDAGTFSFYPAKNLGGWGDAGAVVTARDDVAERVRLLRSHGERPRYRHRIVGTTARLDALQAAILRHKLSRLERWNAARRAAATRLREALSSAERVLAPPEAAAHGDHVYHQFAIRTHDRDEMRTLLARAGVATGVHYPVPIHRAEAYAHLAEDRDVAPVATRLAGELLSLPIFPRISEEQIEHVATAVRKASERLAPSTPAERAESL